MRIVLLFLLAVISNTSWAQNTLTTEAANANVKLMQSFITNLANDSVATDVILSQYLLINKPSDDLYDYLEVSLEEIRINLMTKNIQEISYIPYANMPRKDVNDIDVGDLDIHNMYFLHYRNRQVTALYLQEGKIASFTLVSKGNNKAHFVLY